MKEDIRHLVRLQEIALEIRDLQRLRKEGPGRLAALDEEFTQTVEEIGSERLRHEELVAERGELLQERQDLEQRLQAGQQKLMQVNNQREYSAVLNEIDVMKTRLGDVEQSLAEREGQIEELAGPAAEADERISAEQTKLDEKKRVIEKELESVGTRLEELKGAREELRHKLPPAHLSRFRRIFDARDGVAVTPIDKGACGACHVKLRPQVINLCRRGEDLVACDSCRRILFIPEQASAAAEAPEATEPEEKAAPEAKGGDAAAAAGADADSAGLPGRPAAGA